MTRSSAALVTLGRQERGRSLTVPLACLLPTSLLIVLRCTQKCWAISFSALFLSIPITFFIWSLVNLAILCWFIVWYQTTTHNNMHWNQALVITHKQWHFSFTHHTDWFQLSKVLDSVAYWLKSTKTACQEVSTRDTRVGWVASENITIAYHNTVIHL